MTTARGELSATDGLLRARFSALERDAGGVQAVFCDAPGGTQVPDSVIAAVAGYLGNRNANSHGAFVTSVETGETIARARAATADLLNGDAAEVVFGPNMTTLAFALSRSLARSLAPGDEVVVTRLDHDANIAPWVAAAADAGAAVRFADLDPAGGTLDEESFISCLSGRTRLVAFTLASNALGTITPAARLVAAVKQAGDALVIADGVHLAQHRRIDVAALGADVVFISPYKVFGPHLGVMWARRDLLERLPAYKVRPAPGAPPDRFETGTKAHESLAGWSAAVDHLAAIGELAGARGDRRALLAAAFGQIERYEQGLARRFLDGLGALAGVSLYGLADPARLAERTPTFAVRAGGQHPRASAEALAARGIFAWDGNYYAVEVMERLGLEDSGGALRIGFCHYNTHAEVDRVLEALEALAG